MFWCMGVLMSPRDDFEPDWTGGAFAVALFLGAVAYVKFKGWA